MIQELQQPRVGVLGILHQQHHRILGRQPLEEQPPPGEQLLPRQGTPAVLSDRDAEQQAQPKPDVGPFSPIGRDPVQPLRQLGRGDLRGVLLGDAQPLPDDLSESPERHPLAVGQAPAPMPPHVLGQAVDVLLELPAQPRLAHPGRAGHQHQPRHPPLRRGVEQLLDRAQLRVPSGQRGLQPVDPLAAAHSSQHPGSPPQALRLGLALQRVLPRIGEPDRAGSQSLRRHVGQYMPGFGGRLHPGRGVHRIPGHHPLTSRTQRDRDLAGHHPRPRRQARYPRLGPQIGHGRHQLKPGPHGTLGVSFGGRRGAPHRHHRVPDELLHYPAVPADHRARHREILRQQLPDRLRVLRLRQRGEPDHVAEKHRAHPPLCQRPSSPARR